MMMNREAEEVFDLRVLPLCAPGRRPGTVYELNNMEHGHEVTVDGDPLDPHYEIVNHSPDGLSWGYGGSGPAQLAMALIVDATGQEGLARRYYQNFKWRFISHLDQDSDHVFTVRDVIAWLGLLILQSLYSREVKDRFEDGDEVAR